MQGRSAAGSRIRASASGLPPLTPEEHRILAYASAVGSEFDFGLLVEAMGIDEETLAEQLERLVRRGVLHERAGGERFAFAEEGYRAGVYRSLTESRLRVLHRKIAEVLERRHPTPPPGVLSELGRHYFLGKVPAKSYEYNRRAAANAREAGEADVAIHHLERAAVELAGLRGDHRAERAEIAETLGDLCYASSRFRSADKYYEEALEHVGRDEPRFRARLLLARAEVARENLDAGAAIEGAGAALSLFEGAGDRVGVAQTYRLLGRVAFQQGSYREALDQSMRALESLPDSVDASVIGQLSIDIGNAFAMLGEEVRPVAIEWYERAVKRLRAGQSQIDLTRALHNLGVAVGESRPQDGLEYLEQAKEAAEVAHDSRALGRALLSGVEMRLVLGQVEEAERDNEQAGRLLGQLADSLGLEQVETNRGLIAERGGQWDDAGAAFERAAEMARANHILADEAEARFYLARLRFKTRDIDAARLALRQAAELNVTQLSPRLAPAYAQLVRDLESAEPSAPVGDRPRSDRDGAPGGRGL
ncbi:MAG TPA: tetratricopeptide repeat protein [Thermoplasmata archaeon]|nr:tetratricopeptide repeat protein [Thermoplasmata archaeon]